MQVLAGVEGKCKHLLTWLTLILCLKYLHKLVLLSLHVGFTKTKYYAIHAYLSRWWQVLRQVQTPSESSNIYFEL